jgi:uncharacterized phosphosugar-binding protein
MKMGFAQVSITPNQPCMLAGYYKSRPAEGVHDEVYVRALVFPGPVVMLSLDILNADERSMDRILRALAPLKVEKDRLLITAVHTHASFGGIFDTGAGLKKEMRIMFGEADEALLDMLAERCATAVREALACMEETSLRFVKGSIEGLGTNRHSPELPHDRDLFLIEFFRDDGKKILLYNLSCHPTVLNNENRFISADFPGSVASQLRPFYDMVIFVNGSAGDVSTRFTRRESGFAECDRFGALIARGIMRLVRSGGDIEALDRLELVYHTIRLKAAAVDDLPEGEAKLAAARKNLDAVRASSTNPGKIRKAESLVEAAFINLIKAKTQDGRMDGDISLRTGIFSINGRKILCVPLELFSVLALKLKFRFPEGTSIPAAIFGYANAVEGYLADAAAYEALDYEALSSPFARGEGERYIELLEPLFYNPNMNNYLEHLIKFLKSASETQDENIGRAADLVVESFTGNKKFFVFGSGHSHLIAEELYTRAGGLAFVKAILPPELMLHEMFNKSTLLERLEGYAPALLELYCVGHGDTIMIISNSGRNSVPVEMALAARERGARVIALTSLKHSGRVTSRHSSGKRLFELADVVLDNQGEYGDASFYAEGCKIPIGATSDAVGIALAQALTVRIVEKLVQRGIEPPLFYSSNADTDGANEHNAYLAEKYFGVKMSG